MKRHLALFALAALALVGMGASAGAWEPSGAPPAAAPALEGDLETGLETFVPRQPTSDTERTRLAALALFSVGRMLEQQQDYSGALRRFQRAYRLDPTARPVLQEIVQLAFSLGRGAEAVRYAVKSVQLDPSDPMLIERLAAHLATQGKLSESLALYRQALALRETEKDTNAATSLLSQMGELYLLNDEFPLAADALARVRDALADPEKFKLSAKVKKQIVGRDPARTYEQFGDAFLEAQRWDEAEQAYRKAHELKASPGVLAFHLAQVLAKRGKTEDALTELQKCFAERVNDRGLKPYELWAELLTTAGRIETLLPQVEQLHAADPANHALSYFLAKQYLAAGRWEEAGGLYERLALDQPTSDGLSSLVRTARERRDARALVRALALVIEQAQSLEVLDDAERDAVVQNAELMDPLVAAAREQQAAGELSQPARLGVALACLAGKRLPEAEEFFNLAIAAQPDKADEIFLRWGFGLLLMDAHAEAAAVFQRAIAEPGVAAESPDFRFHLAGALAMADRPDEALVAAREAVELAERKADKHGDKLFRLAPRVAWILFRAKRYEPARTEYEAIIKRFDSVYTTEAARDAVREARFALSNIDVELNHWPEAEEWLEQVLDEYPDDIGALNDLGYLWAEQGKELSRALAMTQQAVAGAPENRAYRDSLGWVLFRLGRHAEAIAELERAASGDEVDGVILEHLADAYAAAGRSAEARRTYERAQSAFAAPDQADERQEIEKKLANLPAQSGEAAPPPADGTNAKP